MGLSVEMEQSAEEWSEIKGLVLCVNGWGGMKGTRWLLYQVITSFKVV